jgi:hypothetical protein
MIQHTTLHVEAACRMQTCNVAAHPEKRKNKLQLDSPDSLEARSYRIFTMLPSVDIHDAQLWCQAASEESNCRYLEEGEESSSLGVLRQ